LEKRYGLDFWRRTSITSARPVVYPPVAPPSAFPRVLLMMSTFGEEGLGEGRVPQRNPGPAAGEGGRRFSHPTLRRVCCVRGQGPRDWGKGSGRGEKERGSGIERLGEGKG